MSTDYVTEDNLLVVLEEILSVKLRPLKVLDTLQKSLIDIQTNQNLLDSRTIVNENRIQNLELELAAQRTIIETQAATIEENSQRIRAMEVDHASEVSILKDDISDLEDRAKQNNIIIHDFVIDQALNRDYNLMAENFFKNKIGKQVAVLLSHPISKVEGGKCMFIVRLHYPEDKWTLLRLRPAFEAMGMGIQLDFSYRTRQKRLKLMEFKRDNKLEGKLLQKCLMTAQGRYEVIDDEVVLLQKLNRQVKSNSPQGSASASPDPPAGPSAGPSTSKGFGHYPDDQDKPLLLPAGGRVGPSFHSGLTPKSLPQQDAGDSSIKDKYIPISQLSLAEASKRRDLAISKASRGGGIKKTPRRR